MRRETPNLLLVAVLTIAGCYSTTTIGGDAGTDPGPDTAADPAVDTAVDPGPDTPPDSAPDVAPDVAPDGGTCPDPSPPPHGPTFSFTVDGTTAPGWVDIDRGCVIESVVSEDEGSAIITLECWDPAGGTETHWIDVYTWPEVYLPVWDGMEVRFRYVAMGDWWSNRWFRLGYPEGVEATIIAGMDADAPNPPIYEDFFPPLSVSARGGYCLVMPGDCFDSERQALDVGYGEAHALVFDSTSGYVGEWDEYAIHVDNAVEHRNFRCTDIAPGRYTALFVQQMWD